MHIGLIGGIGPAATDFYYRELIKHAAAANRDLELTIAHADTPTLLANLLADDHEAQCAIYVKLAQRLQSAGAGNVVVTSIAGHFCIDRFAEISPLPIIDLTKALAAWLAEMGMARVGILGTAPVMRSGMYGKLEPVEVMAPEADELERVHDAYVTLAHSGTSTPQLKQIFDQAGEAMLQRGAEAIMLGGTDLNAAYTGDNAPFPLVDCAGVHAAEIARHI